ncbi:hypothetical protein [Niallia sp. FSL W8-1348]|uniref:hypothetical protein n=1 Tax=Niallia sp. FSL W8-1348 TaxID=2954656 RepID=UPI0030FC31FC
MLIVMVICFLLAGICFWLVAIANKEENRIEDIRQENVSKIIEDNKICVSKRFDMKMVYTLIHDSKNKFIWCIVHSEPKVVIKQFNYYEILQVELKEDDETASVSSRTSQLGGALVGGALAGGVGAVIGGLSGKQKQKRMVKSIKLVLTLDNLEFPTYTFEIGRFPNPVDTTLREYVNVYDIAFNWFKLLEVIIKKSEKECGTLKKNEYQFDENNEQML